MFKKHIFVLLALGISLAFSACSLLKEDTYVTPTKQQMQGTWALTAAEDADGKSILAKVTVTDKLPVFVQFDDANGMEGTIGPLFTYIVYGDSKWVEINSKISQVFDYTKLDPTNGEFGIENTGTRSRCTLEVKLKSTTSVSALTDMLKLLGVQNSFLDLVDETVYHRFYNVKVTMVENVGDVDGPGTMILEFDNLTLGEYNFKNAQLKTVTWNGWPTTSFSKCKLTFKKQFNDLTDLMKSSYSK